MAEFQITLKGGETLTYDTDSCALVWDETYSRVDLSRFGFSYLDDAPVQRQVPFSPEHPLVGKSSAPKTLKIQLGLGCNYACSYCSQGGQVAENTSAEDAEKFDFSAITEAPEKVEFWGGEPILYFHKIQRLVPRIKERWPEARLSLVTNGSLLTHDRIDWLVEQGFSMAISHDGPGQALRGEDPFDSPPWVELAQYAFDRFGERICFNVVLTPENWDLVHTLLWFEARMGRAVRVNVEDVVTDYGGGGFTDEQLQELHERMRDVCDSGLAWVIERVRWSATQFLATLAMGSPLLGGHQVCQMDRPDMLAVDLAGNVLTCQNTGAESGHAIGRIEALDKVRLDTATSYMSRPNCHACPVVHLCYGSCMFLDGPRFDSSCRASYWYNLAILFGAVKLLTGKEVVAIDGWRPGPAKRVIPLKSIPTQLGSAAGKGQ